MEAVESTGSARVRDWLRLIRPAQWVKNFFVMTPLLFSGRATEPEEILRSAAAFGVFCLLASTVYLVNDVADRVTDRSHPIKRHRPVAAGRILPGEALGAALVLGLGGLGFAYLIDPLFAVVGLVYLGLNVLYSVRLKHVVILDVFCIAAFFLLRLLGGSVAIAVHASIWLLLCGGLLSLYLGFAKRRHELLLLGTESPEHRSVLAHYSPIFLDQMSMVLLSVTVVSYIMYTLSKYEEIGSYALTYSSVFVLYGVFRYLYLVHQRERGSPTETLLTDRSLFAAVVLWFLYCAWVIYRPL